MTRPSLPAEAVLCDLDGTLVDTAPDLAESIGLMLDDLGRTAADQPTVESWIGDGVDRLVHRALTGERDGETSADLFARGRARFLEHYGRLVSRRSRPYPGVERGLRSLSAAGIPLACVTSKTGVFTRALLRDLDLARFFAIVVSGDTLESRKPDPAPILHACSLLGAEPTTSVFVGDSENDARAARAAGTSFVAVTYGYNRGRDPRSLEADLLIDSLEDLPPRLGGKPCPSRPDS